MICKICKVEKTKIRTNERHGTGFVYREANGSRWSGAVCAECVKAKSIAWHRKKGSTKSRFDTQNKAHLKGILAERTAAKYFEKIGFKVLNISTHLGPDLILDNGVAKFTCEVKSVGKHKSSYFCNAVKPNRLNDDIIAYVKDDIVIVERMRIHLWHCQKNGQRTLTKFFS